MRSGFVMFVMLLTSLALIALAMQALAHQPFFEDADITPDNPWQIKDPTISTAVYSTLETPEDVDYISFNGSKGEVVLLSITIPQISGQENFTPTMALMGPGLPDGNLPARVVRPMDTGVLVLPPPVNATAFFEPFSRTSYWTRQEQNVTMPASGRYLVAVWDEQGMLGRYVLVIGYMEVAGGDLLFPIKMRSYWTPVNSSSRGVQAANGANSSSSTSQPTQRSAPSDGKSLPGFEVAMALVCISAAAYLARAR